MGDPTQYPDEAVTAELVRPASTAVMTVEQFDSTWRMSRALAKSGSFKDVGKEEPEKALARILLGADLGMSPTQALMGIDIVKGNPQIRGVALGRMVRNSARRPTPTGESYDYKVIARDFTPDAESATVALYRRDEDGQWPVVEVDEGETFDTVLGPVTIRKGARCPEAVEAFKLDQARKRNLIKSDGAWGTQPEVMVVWRALSQLVRFYAPDVIGGMPVYTEADGLRQVPNLSEGAGSGEGPGWGDMPATMLADVRAVIERAKALGHGGLSDEAVIQQRLHGQPFEVVDRWVSESTAILDEMETPADADVVEPLTLTFGGETFEFADANDDPYEALCAALEVGPAAMVKLAGTLDKLADDMEAEAQAMDGSVETTKSVRYKSMAAALVREAGGEG